MWAGENWREEKRFQLTQQAVARVQEVLPDVELVLLTGKPHDQVPPYMSACDALIITSAAEGSPMVIKEAMACNLPIVSCDVGDVPDVIGNTPGCYICRNKTAEDVALHLQRALDFGGRTEGRQAVESYSMPAIAGRLMDYYETLLRRTGKTIHLAKPGKMAAVQAADPAARRKTSPEHSGEDRVMSD